jgi:hypothetical protein
MCLFRLFFIILLLVDHNIWSVLAGDLSLLFTITFLQYSEDLKNDTRFS